MKKIVITTTLLLVAIVVLGQWFVETDIGYVLAMNRKSFVYDNIVLVDNRVNDTYEKVSYSHNFNIIQSPFISFTGGYKLNSWAISFGFSYCDNKTFTSFNKQNSYFRDKSIIWENIGDDRIFVNRSIENYSYSTKGYYVLPEISYIFKLKQFRISPFLGVSLKYLTVYESITRKTTSYILDSTEEASPNFVTERYNCKSSFSNDLSNVFALWSGLQISYDISDNFNLLGKINCSLGNTIRVVEKVQTSYESEFMGNVIESNKNKYVYATDQLWNLNSINFSLGIRYYFNKNTSSKNE
ncbi:MAG: hypothetical protein PHF99_12610 [Bacteroidales bacterium]|jgi:hypothetical protein|nr:hypothetical protein [Bacteroidales bacterium]